MTERFNTMEKIRMGVIGLGQRGFYNLNHYLAKYNDVDVCIVCDLYDDRLERAAKENIPTRVIPRKEYADNKSYSKAILDALNTKLCILKCICSSTLEICELYFWFVLEFDCCGEQVGSGVWLERAFRSVFTFTGLGSPFFRGDYAEFSA